MTDDTTTPRFDTTDPDRPRGDVGLGDARREALAEALAAHELLYDHRCYPAFECSCGNWHGAQDDNGSDTDGQNDNADAFCAHQADALMPLVAGWLGEERAAVESSIREAILQDHVRESTDCGPDFCRTCSEAIQDWVPWPCAATATARGDA